MSASNAAIASTVASATGAAGTESSLEPHASIAVTPKLANDVTVIAIAKRFFMGVLIRKLKARRAQFATVRAMGRSSRSVMVSGLMLAAPVVLAFACGGSDEGATATADAGAVGFVAHFSMSDGDGGSLAIPRFLEVPFPSDVYLENGHYMAELPGIDAVFTQNSSFVTHELAKMNGFSRIATSIFYVDDLATVDRDGKVVSGIVDRASLPRTELACTADTSSVFLIDLEQTDPAKARIGCRALFHDDSFASDTRPMLAVGPARGIVLEEGHKYAAVLTSRVKSASGQNLTASADFKSSIAATGTLYGDAFSKVSGVLASALASDGAEIVSLAPYTTQKITAELFGARETIEAAVAPPLAWDAASVAPMGAVKFAAKVGDVLPAGFTASLDDWLGVATKKLPDGTDDPDLKLDVRAHDAIAAVGTAVFNAANFLQNKGGYDTFDHATFANDASGRVVLQAPAKVWVTFVTPKAEMPVGGYPVVIIQHGLDSSREYMMSMANTFAKKGWVTVAIDSVTFGARAPEPQFQKDNVNSYDNATYKGPDGFADTYLGGLNGPFDMFGNLKNLGALRDQLRQSELDTAQLVKVLRSSPDLSPLQTGEVVPKIDPEKIAYVGDSLGAIEGAGAAAIEPHIKAWMLNVGGAGVLVELASHSPAISVQLAAAGTLNFGFLRNTFDEGHILVSIGQTIIEAGDPIIYATHLVTNPVALAGKETKPRNILQVEVLFDELVPNESNEALARVAGYGLAAPNVGSNAGLFDLKNPVGNDQKVPLLEAIPDEVGIHDTPKPGVTAVVVQVAPGIHGLDMVSSTASKNYDVPYRAADGTNVFHTHDKFSVRCPYREIQATMNTFFEGAFMGNVPVVAGFAAPVRDLDDDGTPDSADPNSNDPTIK